MGRMGGTKLAAILVVVAVISVGVWLLSLTRQTVQAGSVLMAPSPHVSEVNEAIREAEKCMGRR